MEQSSNTENSSVKTDRLDRRARRNIALCVLLVASHTLLLGAFIFWFTETFYTFFFGLSVDNMFFIKQAGLFLLCLGFFYLCPLLNLNRYHPLIYIIIATKLAAVFFLVSSSQLLPRPFVTYLAAFIDLTMALGLCYFAFQFKRLSVRKEPVQHNSTAT
mgnify:CR=1 FL=1